jgi:Icc-related predicted phosphoesterase
VSDVLEPTLTDRRNRAAMGPIDLILGCGDLDFDDLAFVADSFDAPLVYVRGNHDTGDRWSRSTSSCPAPMEPNSIVHLSGLSIGGLDWPGVHTREAARSDSGAWRQAMALATRRLGHSGPLIVISHVPPAGAGDVPTDAYHRGFKGYAWLLRRLQPPLWLHGHTPLASTSQWHVVAGATDVVNVTGAVLIELTAPGVSSSASDGGEEGIASRADEAIAAGSRTPTEARG